MIDRGQLWNRRNFVARCLASSVSLVLLANCGGEQSDPTPLPPAPTDLPAPTEVEAQMPTATPPDNNATPAAEELPQPVILAVAAAASEAGVAEGQVQILSFTLRNWPSTALGCPQPGFSYAQVVTPGFEVLLQVGDQEYSYHTNMAATVVLCTVR